MQRLFTDKDNNSCKTQCFLSLYKKTVVKYNGYLHKQLQIIVKRIVFY